MYKWGFFILSGVNVFLFGNQSFQHNVIEQKIITKEVKQANSSSIDLKNESHRIIKKERKPLLLSVEPESSLESRVKESLLDLYILNARETYTYFDDFNELSADKVHTVELILAEMEALSHGCFGSTSYSEVLNKKLHNSNLSFSEVNHAYDLITQQWTYYHLKELGIKPSSTNGGFIEMVSEVHTFREIEADQIDDLDDPFAMPPFEDTEEEIDPFDEAPIDDDSEEGFEEYINPLEEEVKSELEMGIEIQEGILSLYKTLNESGLKFYDTQLEILSSYMEVPDKLKLKILQDMLGY